MRVFTDDPAAASAIVPQADANRWRRDADVPAREQRIVRALGGTARWSQPLAQRPSFWPTIVIVSDSDGSRFQALDRLVGDDRIERPVAALALTGRGFRGQRDRSWEAAAGNLHLSVAVPIDLDVPRVGTALSMLPVVASVDAIGAASGGILRPGIKWVNDILLDDRKVGGVLSAAHTTAQRIDDVVWGVGINVEVAPAIAPTPFVPAATCLHAAAGGTQVTVSRLFWAMLDALAARHGELLRAGPAGIFADYRAHSVVIGRAVRVWEESAATPFAQGVVTEISSDLGLHLDGRSSAIGRGRLELVPMGPAVSPIDPAIVAAIAAAVSARFPGARVTRVENER
jgi:biotin-[acetyl-CoA-carboxylase] ligase BirA-like protein